MNNLENLPDQLILDLITNSANLNLCNSSKRLGKLCKDNKKYIFKHIKIADFPIKLEYDTRTIMNQINDIKRKFPTFPKEINSNRIDNVIKQNGPIREIIKKNYFQLFDLCIVNKLINIDTLFPYFAVYWSFITGNDLVTAQIFNVINKYKPEYLRSALNYNNTRISNFIGGGSKRSTKKRSTKKRSTKKRSTKKSVKKVSTKKRSVKKRSVKKRSVKKRSVKKRSVKKRSVKKISTKKRSVKKRSVKKRSVKKISIKKRSVKKRSVKKRSTKKRSTKKKI